MSFFSPPVPRSPSRRDLRLSSSPRYCEIQKSVSNLLTKEKLEYKGVEAAIADWYQLMVDVEKKPVGRIGVINSWNLDASE